MEVVPQEAKKNRQNAKLQILNGIFIVMISDSLTQQIARILSLLEAKWARSPAPNFDYCAFVWEKNANQKGFLKGVDFNAIRLSDLHFIDAQKEALLQNTRQFVAGFPANNALLTGARGSGKSSLIRAILQELAPLGLKIIEVNQADLTDLPEIVSLIEHQNARFIIFCDDLSFEADDASYKALKSLLDGSLRAPNENILIYATSNRRHLMPDFFSENEASDEIHPFERTEEKISLSDRFGLWLSFYPLGQNEFLSIVAHWLLFYGLEKQDIQSAQQEALQWALARGSRSARVAVQFARHFAGKKAWKKSQA